MTVLTDIEAGLQGKLNSISGAPYIEWENGKQYKPTYGTRYWRTTHLPANSQLADASGMMIHQGIFQVDVFTPVGTGLKQLLADLDAIYDAFHSVISVSNNGARIDLGPIGRGRVIREDAWCHGYIQINYTCYA